MFDSQTNLFTKMEMETKRSLNFFFSHPLLLFFSIITSPYLLQICSSQDTIAPTQSIIGDQTISSTGDNFLLGFFTPGNSTYRYMGIWYKKVSPRLYVWVSNKDTPLPSSSTAVLRFGEDGNLNLADNTTGKIYWSTNTTVGSRSDANTTKAVLLDSGNLVLTRTINNTETQVWQSFDHPSDVLIPGMKIGLNLKTGQEWYLKSWVDISNPAFGGFVLALDNSSLNQIVSKRGALHWRSGPWNGEGFDGVVEMKANKNMYNYSLVRDGDGVYFSFSTYDPSVISMMIFDSNGKILQLTWNKEIGHWGPVWAHPNNQCEVYDLCGEFGSCKAGPSCNCLKGFEPLSPKNWSSNDWSGGCVRRTALMCGKVDKFFKVGGMRLPDKSVGVGGSSVEECQSKCLGNCTCTAYSYLGLNQCMVWSGGLVDLEKVGSNGHDLYIRLDASELKGTKRWVLALIIVAATVGVILLFGISIFVWRRKAKERGLWKKPHDRSLFDVGATTATPRDSKDANKLRDDDENSGAELPLFDFATVAAATANFSNANKLGEGGFGPVYKGKLPDGQEIAVKRLARSSGQGSEEFKNEVVLLSKLQHRNLVRVLGCCIQGEEKILIYEFMTNKSLDSFIFDPSKRAILDWAKSFRIVEGIAHGLLYLHQYSRLKIIHRDLKASNILLDGEMNPKISDFGMARIFGGNQTQANTNRVVGTYGYMAPEYAMDGQFSVKSDIFSFGVILLEIISGKKNTGFQHEESSSLIAYAWLLWKAGRSSELLDPSLGDSCPTHEVLRCIHVGLLCVQEEAGDRPTMSTVVLMLGSDATTLPEPKKPGFSMGKIANTTDSTGGTSRSINSVTITMIEGR